MITSLRSTARVALYVLRRVAGPDSRLERALRRGYRLIRSRVERRTNGPDYTVFWSGRRHARQIGLFVRGSCDLGSMFSCPPLIQPQLSGTCCIRFEGAVWDSASPLLLQSLRGIPAALVTPVIKQLKLPPHYFQAGQLFEPAIPAGSARFPKNVVVLSIGPDLIRTLYRHREHGYYVDPGGWWFNQGKSTVLSDLAVATWFRRQFENIGRASVDDFLANFGSVVEQVRRRTGARIIVYNALTIEPGSRVYDYRLVRHAFARRAREFNLALVELARRHGFAILDVDRVLKRDGVSGQVDYAHFPPELYPSVAREAVRIMRELEIF